VISSLRRVRRVFGAIMVEMRANELTVDVCVLLYAYL
jgi:hypothetical protein